MDSEGWSRVPLGELLVETHERADTKVQLPVLSVTKHRGIMLAADRFARALHGRDLSKYRVARNGSIVIDPMLLWDGSLGAQDICPAGLVSPDYRVFVPAQATYDSTWLSRLLRSPAMVLEYKNRRRGTNTRRSRISRGDFLEIPVPLPPLGEQRRISSILQAADAAVAAAHAVIEQSRRVRQGVCDELIGRGLRRSSPAQEHSVEDILADGGSSLTYGILQPGPHDPNGIPMLRTVDFAGDRLVQERVLRVAPAIEADYRRTRLKLGDVLLSVMGTVGRVALVQPEWCGWNVNRALAVIRLNASVMPEYFAYWLESSATQTRFTQQKIGSAQQRINLSAFRKFCLPVPPMDEQKRICETLRATDGSLTKQAAELDSKRRVTRGIAAALFTGRTRVPA